MFTFWSLFCFTLITYPTLPYYFHSSPSHNLHLLRPVCDLQFLSLNECYFWRQSWTGYIVRPNFSLFIFVFPFFPFSCWMWSTLTNNLIWIFVAFVIMIVSFALGLTFWQLLPEILTKSHTLSLKTDWEWELIFCRVPVIYICLEESSLWQASFPESSAFNIVWALN